MTICPKCNGNELTTMGPRLFLIGAAIALWVPIVGWVLVPVFLLMAAVTFSESLLPNGKTIRYCHSCKSVVTSRE